MNPLLLCPAIAMAMQGDLPMKTVPDGYQSGVCHYDGRDARGYTLTTDQDVRSTISARYGEAASITSGDETIVTWSDLDKPRPLARDGIRMIVLVRHGEISKVHVSTLRRIATPMVAPR